jgi:diguanylate cyclase (GGDEF)-like protein
VNRIEQPPATDPRVAAYTWDMASDRLEWDGDPVHVLGLAAAAVATGGAFESHLAPEQRALRRSAMASGEPDPEAGTRYTIRIGFLPAPGAEPVWLEETCRIWANSNGCQPRARGVLRRVDAEVLADQRLLLQRPDDVSAGGLNRSRLMEDLGARLRRAERTGGLCALLMVTVNGIDAVNAQLGFDIGDELIAAAGHLLRSNSGEASAVYRYASNTLAVVEDLRDVAALETSADAFMSRVRDTTIQTSAGPLRATLSVGATVLPLHAATVTEAVAQALDALEKAKRHPQGALVVHGPEMASERAARREKALSSSVVAALEDGRLLLALQPIVDAETGKPVYYEGLLRLRRTDGSLASASEFVADAEKLGLVRLIDMRALELGLSLLTRHKKLSLSLNVSSLTAGDSGWLTELRRRTDEEPDLACRLIVEITETALIHDLARVAAFVDALRQLGCKVAIDDFGSGYTSFRFLKTLKVDILKIDGLFVADLANDAQGRTIVKTMIDMAKALQLETVAEWVSDETSRDVLREAGATYFQGYLYGRPMLVEDLEQRGLL